MEMIITEVRLVSMVCLLLGALPLVVISEIEMEEGFIVMRLLS